MRQNFFAAAATTTMVVFSDPSSSLSGSLSLLCPAARLDLQSPLGQLPVLLFAMGIAFRPVLVGEQRGGDDGAEEEVGDSPGMLFSLAVSGFERRLSPVAGQISGGRCGLGVCA